MIDLNEIRQGVAIKHNFWLDENDPMLMTVTINEIILSQYVEMLATQNAEYAKALEAAINAAIQKGVADSKLTAGRVITEGGDYVSERVRAAVTEVLKEAEAQAQAAHRLRAEKEEGAWKENYMFLFMGMGLMAVPLVFNIFMAKGWI